MSDVGEEVQKAIAFDIHPSKKGNGNRRNGRETMSDNSPKAKLAKSKLAIKAMFGIQPKIKEKIGHCAFEKKLYNAKHHSEANDGYLLADRLVATSHEEASPGLVRSLVASNAYLMAIAMLVSVCVTSVVAPISFMKNGSIRPFDRIPGGIGLVAIDIAMDLVYATFLWQRLSSTFIHPVRNVEVVDHKEVWQYWLTNPVYWLQAASVTAYFWAVCGVNIWINLLKIVRLKHLLELPDPLWQIRDNLKLRLAISFFLLVLASHWVACLLFLVGDYYKLQQEDDSWGRSSFRDPTGITRAGARVEPFVALYFEAFIEAICMLTGALDNPKGDSSIRETNTGAMMIVIIMGPVGCIVVSIFVSQVCRMLELSSALEIRQEQKKAFITRALQILDVPPDLQRRVHALHQFQKLNHDNEAFNVLFDKNTLSIPLEGALRVYLYSESVLFSPFFVTRTDDYIVEVVKTLEDQVYIPGDYLTRRGELATGMFFLGSGTVSVLVPGEVGAKSVERATKIGTKTKGDFFGEVSLIQECLRTAWVRADTYVVAQVLSRAALEPIWRYFPEERELLAARVTDVIKKDRQRHVKNQWKSAEKKVVQALNADLPVQSWGGGKGKDSRSAGSSTKAAKKGVAFEEDVEVFDVRSGDDVEALQKLGRLCETLLVQQGEMQGVLTEIWDRQAMLGDGDLPEQLGITMSKSNVSAWDCTPSPAGAAAGTKSPRKKKLTE